MTDQQLEDDSPPDSSSPGAYHTPIDHLEVSQPYQSASLAETEQKQEDGPNLVVKKGIGRPRKDGLPAKTDTLVTQKTPRPMYKRFYTDAANANQKPAACFKWCRALPKWAQERLTFYVYRDWPTLKNPELDMVGVKEDNIYIEKMAECPETVTSLLDAFGAGDYRIFINDQMVDMQNIAEIHIREGWRNVVQNPPTDRRIDDVDNVDLESSANKSYIQYLKNKGKLPEQVAQREKGASMAEATATAQMAGLLRDLISAKRDDKGNNDTTATVVKEVTSVLGDANKHASEIMKQGYESIEKVRAQQTTVDPIEYIKAAAELMRPQQVVQGDGGNSQVVDMLKSFLETESRRTEAAEKRANDLMDKLLTDRVQAQNPPPQAPVTQPDALATTKATIESVMGIASALGLKAGGGGGGSDVGEKVVWWKEALPDMMQSGASVIQNITQLIMANQRRQMPQQPPMPQHVVPQEFIPQPQQIQPQPIQEPTPTDEVQLENQQEQEQEQMNLAAFMKFAGEIKRPLMNHINRNLGGAAFAQWVIDTYDDATYQQMKMQGSEMLVEGLKMYPPIWEELEPKVSLLPQFVDEFMRMEEIVQAEEMAQMEDQEDEEDEEGELTTA
jgi:hypothetical protein